VVFFVFGSEGVVASYFINCLLADVRIRPVFLNTQRDTVGGVSKGLDTLTNLDSALRFILDGWRTQLFLVQTVSFGPLWTFANPFPEIGKTHAFRLVDFQTLADEVLDIFGDGDGLFELDGDSGHLIDQFVFGFALPGSLPVQHLIDHDADRPDIVLDGVYVLLEGLRGHVERTAHIVLLLLEGGTAWMQTYCDFLAKPKSAILATPLLMKMLANLRSLWRNLFSPI